MIKEENGKFIVYSEEGKRLSKPYNTRSEAEDRLREIEYFKREDKEVDDSMENEQKQHFHFGTVLEVKELEESLVVKGFIATTHKDSGNDIIQKETLDVWAKEINEGNPRANKISVNHKRVSHPAGMGIKGSAKVVSLEEGHYGLYVESKIDKTREDYKEIEYRIKEGFLDSFSIEYVADSSRTDNKEVRVLGPGSELHGWTLASQPMNEYAVMMKEKYSQSHSSNQPNEQKEENTMTEEQQIESKEFEAMKAQIAEFKEYKEAMEADKKKAEEEKKKEKAEEAKAEEKKEILNHVLESKEFSEKLDAAAKKGPTMNTKEDEGKETLELKEYKQIFEGKESLSVHEQLRRAINLAEKEKVDLFKTEKAVSEREFKQFVANGKKLEAKGLGIGDNLNSAYVNATTGVGLPQAELQEYVDPVLYNALNDEHILYGQLKKENNAGNGTNQKTFVLITGRNPTAGAYTGNEVSLGKAALQKYTTKFKKYQAGFAIDGDLIAANRGAAIGEVMSIQMERAMQDLMKVINEDLFKENGAESAAEIIGLKYIADSAGNTTLYSTTRSAENKLAPDTATDTYIDGSSGTRKENIRSALKQIREDGGIVNRERSIIVMSPLQSELFKDEFDNAVRLEYGTKGVGLTSTIEFFEDSTVFIDADCPDASIFVFDIEAFKMAFWVPPTVEMLGKRNDSVEGFVKTYFCTYSTAPRRVVEIYAVPLS